MNRTMLLWGVVLVLVSLGCSKSTDVTAPTGVDTQTVEEYQAQSEGDAYDNYKEPK
ncbi:hypothetical protein [Rubripirellula reticaptiva]|uniref:Secreted protein n=1 Tax=Rubripirellula reticaptiva TaxID=2528013 RepID=A0A5C6F1D1_9BACT|nr:hypothetical protein [Rubripirellula reticaptiva]TWU55062.1 hypothetical protein Poly59_13550 [Rubripirellula reticaptiva]